MPRAMIRPIVEINPIGERIKIKLIEKQFHTYEQFRLAVVTPIRCISPIAHLVHFMGLNKAMGDVEVASNFFGHITVCGWIGGRDRGHRQSVGAQGLSRRPGEIAGINTPGKRDKQPARLG